MILPLPGGAFRRAVSEVSNGTGIGFFLIQSLDKWGV